MILTLDELVARLKAADTTRDTGPGEALWIKLGSRKSNKTVEYRTATGNEIVHVYLDEDEGLVGIEIFS
jgi:hypothetical protein